MATPSNSASAPPRRPGRVANPARAAPDGRGDHGRGRPGQLRPVGARRMRADHGRSGPGQAPVRLRPQSPRTPTRGTSGRGRRPTRRSREADLPTGTVVGPWRVPWRGLAHTDDPRLVSWILTGWSASRCSTSRTMGGGPPGVHPKTLGLAGERTTILSVPCSLGRSPCRPGPGNPRPYSHVE